MIAGADPVPRDGNLLKPQIIPNKLQFQQKEGKDQKKKREVRKFAFQFLHFHFDHNSLSFRYRPSARSALSRPFPFSNRMPPKPVRSFGGGTMILYCFSKVNARFRPAKGDRTKAHSPRLLPERNRKRQIRSCIKMGTAPPSVLWVPVPAGPFLLFYSSTLTRLFAIRTASLSVRLP